jgi:dihydrofolate reductase
MRKVRMFEHTSLDGVIQMPTGLPGGEFAYGDWTSRYRTPTGAGLLAESYGSRYDLLLGRRTYDGWSTFWPKMKGGPFADAINAATKYVVTHRPESLEWGPVEAVGSDIVADVQRLKSMDGPDMIVCGSSTVTRVLLDQGLVDELVLIVYPLLLGQGKRFFSDGPNAREFEFGSTRTSPTGLVVNTYRYVGALPRPEPRAV